MTDLRIERVNSTRDEASGAVVHEHHLYEGDQKVGSFHVATHPERAVPSFKLKGVKTGQVRQIMGYVQEHYAPKPLAKAKAAAKDAPEVTLAGALESRFGSDGSSAGTSAMPQAKQDPSENRVRQKATCTTEGCGGTLRFTQVRNKHGFEQTYQQCPSCGASEVVKRHKPTAAESEETEKQAARERIWKEQDNVQKAMGPDGMTPAKGAEEQAPVELDHDRRRVKNAVMALLGKIETPHSPDGKVNRASLAKSLAKSIVSEKHYESLVSDLRGIANEIVSRPAFHEKHDQAALMTVYAQAHLARANDLLQIQSTKPRRVDGLRSMLGLEPLHDKHLNTARAMIRAAKVLTVHGDNAMHEAGHYPKPTPFSQNPQIPSSMSSEGHGAIKRAFKRHAFLVEGAAEDLKGRMSGKPVDPMVKPKPGIKTDTTEPT